MPYPGPGAETFSSLPVSPWTLTALTRAMEPTEHESIARRLHSLGTQPLDPEVSSRHRSLIASVPVASSRSRLRPLMVGSLLAGSLLGGMGLAAAAPGVPGPASDVAKTVLATVTLGAVDRPDHGNNKGGKADDADDTPEAKAAAQKAKDARKAAKAKNHPAGTHGVARNTAACPPGFTGNHGQYVSSVAKDPNATEEQKTAAAKSDCGKPLSSVHPATPGADDDTNKPASPGKSDEEHGQGAGQPATEHGQSDDDHPGDRANRKAVDSVEDHRKAGAGRSAGRGPVS